MGWQDAPVVGEPSKQPAWQSAPEVSPSPKLSPMQDIMQSTDWAGLRRLGYGLAPSIAPMVGAVGMTPMLGPVGGAITGGVMGEAFNNAIGLTEPSIGSYAAQGLIPPALKGVAGLKRVGGAFGEKAGAETLNRLASPEIRNILQQYKPPTPSNVLFQKIDKSQAQVPVPATRQTSQEQIANIGKSMPGFRESYNTLKKQLEGVRDQTKKTGFVPIQTYQRLLHDVGTHIKAADRAGGVEAAGYKSLYKSLMEDLEKAPSRMKGPEAKILAEARDAFKRERVLEDIGDLARPFTMAGHGDVERFRANKIINRLKDPDDALGKFYQQSFTPDEQKGLMSSLVTLNKIPPIPAPRGTDAGSKERLGQIAGILGGGGAGAAAGAAGGLGAEGAGLGAAAGYLIPKIHTMVTNYNIANNTQAGKALIKELWQGSGGKFSPQFWSALEAFAASQAANPNAELFKLVGVK